MFQSLCQIPAISCAHQHRQVSENMKVECLNVKRLNPTFDIDSEIFSAPNSWIKMPNGSEIIDLQGGKRVKIWSNILALTFSERLSFKLYD